MANRKSKVQDNKTKNSNKEAVLELAYLLYDLYKENYSERELYYEQKGLSDSTLSRIITRTIRE